MEEQLPSFNGFLRVLNKYYKIDKYIAKMTQKYEVFQMKWLRYKDLLDPSQWQRFTVCNSNYNRPHIIYPVNYSISSEPFLSYKIFFVFVSFFY